MDGKTILKKLWESERNPDATVEERLRNWADWESFHKEVDRKRKEPTEQG